MLSSDYSTVLEGTFRFVSVDGSHDADTVLSDLHLAERMLVKGGVVALDDWNDTGQWPGGPLLHLGGGAET